MTGTAGDRAVPVATSTQLPRPHRVFRSDVRSARRRLAGLVRKTPVFHTDVRGPRGPVPVSLKLEFLQHGGTFKIRGVFNAMLEHAHAADHVVIASSGNAGIAAALASARLDKTCTVVVPESAPHTKVAAMWTHGAEVIWHGTSYDEAAEHAALLAADRTALHLHAYDLPALVAGTGVLGLELEEQVRGRPPVLAAVGGGALVAGLGTAFGRRRPVVGIESDSSPALSEALRAGRPVPVGDPRDLSGPPTATRIGAIALAVARRNDMRSVLVGPDAVAAARDYLWQEFRVMVEPAGAAALAAVQTGDYVPDAGERPVIVLCGANTELPVL